MSTRSKEAFLAALSQGVAEFQDTIIKGDIDFGERKIAYLSLERVKFTGELTGVLTIDHLVVVGPRCVYRANIPMNYTASCVKDLTE